MNTPTLPSRRFSILPSNSILLFAVGIPLVLWLFYGGENPEPGTSGTIDATAAVVTDAQGTAGSKVAGVHPQSTAATPAPPATAAPLPPLPAIQTLKDLNTIADGPWPVAEKIRLLTAAARLANPSNMPSEAAKRLVFIVKDADYPALMAPVLFDPQMPVEVLESIALNMHSRPPEVVKPLLERLAASPDHPLHIEATETLAFHRQAGSL